MRKTKLLAIAMAAVVGMSSVPAVYRNVVVAEAAVGDATAKDLNIDKAFSSNTGDEEVKGDFELTYKFTNKSAGTNNWDNYIVEIFDGNGQFISTRADNYGWFAGDWTKDGSEMAWGNGLSDWTEFNTAMKDASVTVVIKRVGQTVTITNEAVSNTDATKKYSFTATCNMKALPDTLKVHITGEKVGLSNITTSYKAIDSSAEPTPTAEPEIGQVTVKELEIAGGLGSANTGDEKITGDFEFTYKFTNKSVGTENYHNYVVELYNNASYISTRADNYGWFAGDWKDDGSTMTWGEGLADWTDFNAAMKDASVTVTVKRVGQKVTVTNDIVSNADATKKYNFVATCEMKNLPETLRLHLTGEKVNLSNITTEYKKVDASLEPSAQPSAAPGTDATPAPGTDATPAPGTDATPAPGTNVTPAPGTNATPAPGTNATPAPGTNATPAPGTNATPAPGTSAEPTVAPSAAPTAKPSTAPTKKPSNTTKKLKSATITVKNGKKKVTSVSVKAKKSVNLTVSVNSKAKLSVAKLSKKDAKIAKVTFKNNKLTIKGLKKGKVSVKITSKKTSKYKAATKTVKVTVK